MSDQGREVTEGNSTEFCMEGGDIIRADGTCAGYTSLDFQAYFHQLEQTLAHERELREAADQKRKEAVDEFLLRVAAYEVELAELAIQREAAEAEARKDIDFWTQQAADNAKDSQAYECMAKRYGGWCATTYQAENLPLKVDELTARAEAAEAAANLNYTIATQRANERLEAAEAERDSWQRQCQATGMAEEEALEDRDAVKDYASRLLAALTQQRQALEDMGRRLHIIDHGAIMPPFELCQDMACDARWLLIGGSRRFEAIQDWRQSHPNYAPAGWVYGEQLAGEIDYRTALATDTAALVTEGTALGVTP